MADVKLLAGRPERAGDVPDAVVAEHASHPDPARPEPGDRARQKGRAGRPELVGEDFDIRDPAVIVDGDLQQFVTRRHRARASCT